MLLEAGRIEMRKLSTYFDEIMQRYGTKSLKQDPDEYEQKFVALQQMWRNQ